jgi:predicted transcriptional regulator
MSIKEKMKALIEEQPEDATYEEIIRELKFAEMVEKGLDNTRQGRVISNEELGRRISAWQK